MSQTLSPPAAPPVHRPAAPPPAPKASLATLVVVGLVGGLLSGLLGVGGGVIMVPLLVLWLGYDQRVAHATSLGAIIPIGIAGLITYGAAGEVRVPEAVALIAGSLLGARIGAGVLARIAERPLKAVFGAFLVLVSITMVLR